MAKKQDPNAGDKYLKPRDRFYEFLEKHEVLGKERRKAERKGAVYMVVFLCVIVTLAVATHEQGDYDLIQGIFG